MSNPGRAPSPTLPRDVPHFVVDPHRPSSRRKGISIGGGGEQPLEHAFFYQIDEAARMYDRGTNLLMRDMRVAMQRRNLVPCTGFYISALIFDADGRLLLACPGDDEDEQPGDSADDVDDTLIWMLPGTWCKPTHKKVLNYLTDSLWKNLRETWTHQIPRGNGAAATAAAAGGGGRGEMVTLSVTVAVEVEAHDEARLLTTAEYTAYAWASREEVERQRRGQRPFLVATPGLHAALCDAFDRAADVDDLRQQAQAACARDEHVDMDGDDDDLAAAAAAGGLLALGRVAAAAAGLLALGREAEAEQAEERDGESGEAERIVETGGGELD
ncbi:hypothetical protein F4809DRAFT_663790 [Biscogniauxia mediterranea]|nr:hypothetical protein F4809DRAFT_663790 [Biscogniauxia mediterranea]